MAASRLDAGLFWLLAGGLGGVCVGEQVGRPLLGVGLGAGAAALFMPHLHPNYGRFGGDDSKPALNQTGALDGIAAHPEDTGTKQPGVGYYAVPALLGGVAGATAGDGQPAHTRLLYALVAGGGAAGLAYWVRPHALPAARNNDQEIAWEAIIQAEKDTFGNVIALSMWGPLTYWSATKASHPLLALALMGGGVAMIHGAAQNIIETRQLRRRFIAAVGRSEVKEAKLKERQIARAKRYVSAVERKKLRGSRGS